MAVKFGATKNGFAAEIEANVPPLLKPEIKELLAADAIAKRLFGVPGVMVPFDTVKLFNSGVFRANGSIAVPGNTSPKRPMPPRRTVLPFFVGMKAKPTRGCLMIRSVDENAWCSPV